MTLEEMTRKEHPHWIPRELDLFCYCVNAEVGHLREDYTEDSKPIYRCSACGIKRLYSEVEDEC